MKKHNLLFTRTDHEGVDVAMTVSLECDADNPLKRLTSAISNWMLKTEEGKSAFRESCGDFNVGDFSNYELALKPYLENEGVFNVELHSFCYPEMFNYDKHLFDLSESEEEAIA